MATAYGSYATFSGYSFSAFRAVMDYSISSENETTATVKIVVKCQMADGHDSGDNFSATGTISGTSTTKSGSGYYSAGSTYTIISSHTKSITKGTSATSVAVSGSVSDTYMGGSSTASATISVKAKTSYAVTYNANGGSGAPNAQTKLHGTTLTLSTTRPTRSNYNFLGWATSSTATTAAYQPGASYTANAALTLYAVWQLAAASPTLKGLSAYRSDSSGNADPTGTTYVTFKATWSVDSGASTKKMVFSYKEPNNGSGGTQQNKELTLSGTSGTVTQPYAITGGLNANQKLPVTITITDVTHSLSVTKVASVPVVFKPFTMANKGKAAALFGIAGAAWDRILHVFGDLYQTKEVPRHYVHFSSHNTQVGQESTPTEWTELESYCSFDNAGTQSYYSQLAFPANSTALYRSYVVRRLKADGTAMLGGFYTYLDADGDTRLALTGLNVKGNWFSTIGAWTSLASTTGTTQKTFALPAAYSELLVTCTHTSGSARDYGGSVVIPKAQVSSTVTEWYLGGGVTSSSATSGRVACFKLTNTYIQGTMFKIDGTSYSPTWTVYYR